MESLEVADLRNIRHARCVLGPGLNVFAGRNAQGKTSLLEAVALLARGRSFRTDEVRTLVRRGAASLCTRGATMSDDRVTHLEVEVGMGDGEKRRLRVDGRDVPPRAYQGRLEAVVYSTDRLRVVRGPLRDRRQFLDRGAAALWPVYRQTVREYERIVRQRNAALEQGARDLPAWDERFLELGATLRERRAEYVRRLRTALGHGFSPRGEVYDDVITPAVEGGVDAQRRVLETAMVARRRDEQRARRSLVGPHRDEVALQVNGVEAGEFASSGQARSLLLALALATLAVYREEQGQAAVALLDDLDSELDEERTAALCHEVASRGQALVTTAHPGWARRLGGETRLFTVDGGEVTAA
ncbi:MAG: DNA replication/repair protein RecF [bacterium]